MGARRRPMTGDPGAASSVHGVSSGSVRKPRACSRGEGAMRKTLLTATPVSILSSVMLATLGYYEIIRFPSVASWLIFIAGVVSLVSSTVVGCCLLVIDVRTATRRSTRGESVGGEWFAQRTTPGPKPRTEWPTDGDWQSA